QAEDGIRDFHVTGVQTCALPICADIVCFDDSPAQVERAKAEGIPVADLRESDWSGFSVLVLAPGVPLTHPVPHWSVGRARAQGIDRKSVVEGRRGGRRGRRRRRE